MIAEEAIQNLGKPDSVPGILESSFNELAENWVKETLFVLADSYKGLFKDAQIVFENNYGSIPSNYNSLGKGRIRKVAFRVLEDLTSIMQEFNEKQISIIGQYLQVGVTKYLFELDNFVRESPENIDISFTEHDLRIHEDDPSRIKWNKRWKNVISKIGISAREEVQYQVLLKAEINQVYLKNFLSYLKAIGTSSENICREFELKMRENLQQIENLQFVTEDTAAQKLAEGAQKIEENFVALHEILAGLQDGYLRWLEEFHAIFQLRFESDIRRPGLSKFVDIEGKEGLHWEKEIKEYPADWQANQYLFHNHINGAIELWKVQIHLERVSDQVEKGVKKGFLEICDKAIQKNSTYITKLGETIEKEDWKKLAQMGTGIEDMVFFEQEDLIGEPMASLNFVTERLASSIGLIPLDELARFREGKVKRIESIPVALSSIVNFVVRTYYLTPISNYLQKLPDSLKQVGYQVQNSIHLISLNLVDDSDAESDLFNKKRLSSVLRKSAQKLENAQEILDKIEAETQAFLDECEAKTRQELNPSELVDHAAQFDREIKGEERLEGLVLFLNQIWTWIKKQFNTLRALWYNTQSELDLVERESAITPGENMYARLRNFVEEVSPVAELDKLLPYHYRQLFLGRPSVSRSFLPGREKEMEQASDAARRMQNKVGGAILVLGDSLSGKTTLCEHTAEYLFEGKVYRINPPINGSIKLKSFTNAFIQATQGSGSLEQLIESTIHGSVFILNDLELWWERSPDGLTVLEKLSQLIDEYGNEYYFIINCNIHSYNLISRIHDISERFITTIRLAPMSRENIQKIVLSRHYSSNVTFNYKDQEQSLISNRKLNRLFKRYTDISSGNIGYAFLMWLANIESFKQKNLGIKEPKYVDMPVLLEPDWLLLLHQLLIHHRLTKEQMKRVYRLDNIQELDELIGRLLRAGLIREYQGNAYTLNPFIYPHLMKQLSDKQLI